MTVPGEAPRPAGRGVTLTGRNKDTPCPFFWPKILKIQTSKLAQDGQTQRTTYIFAWVKNGFREFPDPNPPIRSPNTRI